MCIPSSYILPVELLNIDKNYIASGGFSDVFHGTYRDREVCVKRLRVSATDIPGKVIKGRIYRSHRQSFAVS